MIVAEITQPRIETYFSYCYRRLKCSITQHLLAALSLQFVAADLKEIYKGRRILEFITFYHNALHLTRVHCATNNSNKNTGKFGG